MTSGARATIFSTCFGAFYFACFYFDIALFRFYPQTGVVTLGETAAMGPPIVWYGWIAAAAVGSGAVALIVPAVITPRMPPSVCWMVTAIVVLVMLVYERRWFV